MQKHCPVAWDEMRGTAEGSGVPLAHLMQLTIFPELEAFDHFHPFRCDATGCANVIQDSSWRQCEKCEQDFCLACSSLKVNTCDQGHPLTQKSPVRSAVAEESTPTGVQPEVGTHRLEEVLLFRAGSREGLLNRPDGRREPPV